MNKKSQQKIHDNMQTCDDNYEKYMKQEGISELNLLKFIDQAKRLESEEKQRLQKTQRLLQKQMKCLYELKF